jgi:hypothetical protein
MDHPLGRPTPGVQEPDVRVEWVRAEHTPQQARAWRDLWQKLLATNAQAGETALSPTLVQADGETCDDADHEHDGLEDLSHER